VGSRVAVGNLPPEADQKGALNESTPADQRVANVDHEMSPGPIKGEKDEFLPATYKLGSGNIRTDR